MAIVIFGVTVVPTFLMGLSLPLLAKFPQPESAADWISSLYGWNTLGAALGSLTAVTVLLPSLDLRHRLLVGAGVSGSCALAALLVCLPRISESSGGLLTPTVRTTEAAAQPLPFSTWLLL